LDLGRYLVDETLGERSNDTLSRWLLHAIAERIANVQSAKRISDRKRCEDEAADLILRLWKHRAVAPMGVDPLAKYDRVLMAFRSLLPGSNPWQTRDAQQNDRIAAKLYESFSMLTLSLLLIGLEDVQSRSATEKALHAEFLPANESAVLLLFEQIEDMVSAYAAGDKRAPPTEDTPPHRFERTKSVQLWADRLIELAQGASALVNELESSDTNQVTKRRQQRKLVDSGPKPKDKPLPSKSKKKRAVSHAGASK
jgi:hypothetical protein